MDEFQELNVIETEVEKRISKPYDEYFGDMDLSAEEIKKRIAFSDDFEDVIFYIFALISVMNEYDRIQQQYIIEQLQQRYLEVVAGFITIDEYINDYIGKFSNDTIETTLKNLSNPFFLSEDRGILISENEANSVFNHDEFSQAILNGYTMKRWVDIRDNRERETHRKVGGTTIPIMQPFVVGNYLMMYPKDTQFDASIKEIANCRCTIQYF